MLKILFPILLIFLISCGEDQEVENHFKGLCLNNGEELNYNFDSNYKPKNRPFLMANSPIYHIDKNEVITDSILFTILKSKRENYDNFYSSSIDALYEKEKNNKKSSYYRTILNEYLHNNKIHISLSDKLLNIIEIELQNAKFSTYQDIYFTSQLLNNKSELLFEQNKTIESLVVSHYLLYLLEKSDKSENLIYLKDNVRLSICHILLKEQNQDKYSPAIQTYFNQLSDETNNNFYSSINRFYYFSGVDKPNSDSIFNYLYQAKKRIKHPKEQFILNFNMGYQYESTNQDSAKHYYHQASQMFPDSSCYFNKYMLLLYIQEYLTDEEQQKKYQERIDDIYHCSQDLIDRISFIRYQYINPVSLKLKIDSTISIILSERTIAEKIYTGSSTLHLQDYYATNCIRLLEILKDEKVETLEKHKEAIINLVYDTRAKEKYRIKNLHQHIDSLHKYDDKTDNIYEQIAFKLSLINEFKAPKLSEDVLYKELYDLYQLKNRSANNTNNVETIKIPDIKQNTLILDFISDMEDYYYYYALTNEGINVHQIDKIEFDSLSILMLDRIVQKEDFGKQVSELRNMFSILNLNSIDEIIVIPDGIIGQLPLELIFDDVNTINQYQDINKWLNSDISYISKNNILLGSYSDKSTTKEKGLRKYIELPYAHEECKSIIKELGLHKKQLLAGKSFESSRIFANDEIELLHLSTHASSSFGNRLDNYFIVRSENGTPRKIYSYELGNKNIHPKLVCISACESGIGVHEMGAGVFTISRAFIDNETETVLKTLWKINEKATSLFMTQLYVKWGEGITFGEALQWTKEQFKTHQQYSHPYYWAGFVIEGNPDMVLK